MKTRATRGSIKYELHEGEYVMENEGGEIAAILAEWIYKSLYQAECSWHPDLLDSQDQVSSTSHPG